MEGLKRLCASLGKGSSLSGYDSGMIRGYASARWKTELVIQTQNDECGSSGGGGSSSSSSSCSSSGSSSVVVAVAEAAAAVVVRQLCKRRGTSLGKGSSFSGYDSSMIRRYDSASCQTELSILRTMIVVVVVVLVVVVVVAAVVAVVVVVVVVVVAVVAVVAVVWW